MLPSTIDPNMPESTDEGASDNNSLTASCSIKPKMPPNRTTVSRVFRSNLIWHPYYTLLIKAKIRMTITTTTKIVIKAPPALATNISRL